MHLVQHIILISSAFKILSRSIEFIRIALLKFVKIIYMNIFWTLSQEMKAIRYFLNCYTYNLMQNILLAHLKIRVTS
jgi:hypothetical protein